MNKQCKYQYQQQKLQTQTKQRSQILYVLFVYPEKKKICHLSIQFRPEAKLLHTPDKDEKIIFYFLFL